MTMKKQIFLYYHPDFKDLTLLEDGVKFVNSEYERCGLPIEARLLNLEEELLKFSKEELSDKLNIKADTKEEIVRIALTPEPFEAGLKEHGIYEKDGKWFKDGNLLQKIALERFSIEPDFANYRFKYKGKISKEIKIKATGNVQHYNSITKLLSGKDLKINEEQFKKNVQLEYKKLLLSDLLRFDVSSEERDNIEKLENQLDDVFLKNFYYGDEKIDSYLDMFDQIIFCSLYVNQIKDTKKRRLEFNKMVNIFTNNFLYDKFGKKDFILIKPFEGYLMRYMKQLGNIENILSDKNKPDFISILLPFNDPEYEKTSYCMYYTILRPSAGFKSLINIGHPNKKTLREVKYKLLHELCHHFDIPDDNSRIDRGDDDIMTAPVKFNDPSTDKKLYLKKEYVDLIKRDLNL